MSGIAVMSGSALKVLVTGGTSGLGLAMASALAAAVGVHDERIVAVEFERWLRDWKAAGKAGLTPPPWG